MKLLNKVKFILLIIFFIALIFGSKCFAVTGEITEITVNLRKEPSTDSKKIMYVTQDDVVEVLEKVGDWYKIKFEGKTGYVFGEYLKVDDSKLEEVPKEDEKVESTEKELTTKTEQKVEDTKNEVQEITTDIPVKLQIKEKTQVRLIPNITSNIIYTAKKALSIEIIDQVSEWSYISVDNITGWVRTDNIVEENLISTDKKEDKVSKKDEEKSSDVVVKETKIAYIKYDTVNLRKKASTSATVLAKLKLNDKVTVLEEVDSKWSKVKVDGITGYVSTELLSDKKQEVNETKKEESTTSRDGETTSRNEKEEVKEYKKENSANKEDTKTEIKQEENKTTEKNETVKEESKENTTSKVSGQDIVEYAKKYLGYDYVLGGTSPKTGFDCSGFTKYVYNHFGYKLSRTSKAQAKNGKEVAKSDLQPGDIIIFKNQSLTSIGHVGIYIGNNKIIHASEPGVGVVITDMNASGYNYNKRYVTARRII